MPFSQAFESQPLITSPSFFTPATRRLMIGRAMASGTWSLIHLPMSSPRFLSHSKPFFMLSAVATRSIPLVASSTRPWM